MINVPKPLRSFVQILTLASVITLPQIGSTQCVGIKEEGRWRNLANNDDPAFIDVKMLGGCGDQVLNGESTGSSTRYTLRVWVRQSSGQFFGRPSVKAAYRSWNGKRWLQGNVPTGGYVDQMWLHAEDRDGRPQLHVVIKHQSLDSKPSSQSEYWCVK